MTQPHPPENDEGSAAEQFLTSSAKALLKELQVVHDQSVMTKAPAELWERAAILKIQKALSAYHETLHKEWMMS